MHLKIHFNDKPLYLADQINSEIEPLVHHDDAVFMDELSAPGINSMIHEMRQHSVHAGVFIHPDLQQLQKAFWRKFTIVQAAGGLIVNEKGQVLMMFRRNKWDLPKGKLDPGESLESCAVREVREETGLKEVKIRGLLIVTFHTYDESGKHILKETHWYKMDAPGDQPLQPETSEQISEVGWVDKKQLPELIKDTYPSIVDVFKAGGYFF